jgi:hypothetical protein
MVVRLLAASFLWAVALASVFPVRAQDKESPAAILASLPVALGSFEGKTELTRYPDPKLGQSRAYHSRSGVAITIYLYDLGQERIAPGVSDQVVKDAFASSKAEILAFQEQGVYAEVQLVKNAPVAFKVSSGRDVQMLSSTYNLSRVDKTNDSRQPVVSQVLLTGARDHILKLRITHVPDLPKQASLDLKETLQQIIDAIAGK